MPKARAVVGVLALATFFSLAIAFQNLPAVRHVEPNVTLFRLFLLELPVWLGWAATVPVVGVLVARFPLSARTAPLHFAAAWVLIGVVVAVVVVGRGVTEDHVKVWWHIYRRYAAFFLTVYGMIAAFLQARARERQAAALEARLHEARLQNLRSQLDPHFLFNALHAISALMGRDVVQARRMIARLSDLLRLSLSRRDSQRIPLDQELEMLALYLDVQRMRFGDRLQVDVDVEPAARRAQVPALTLQPLVENAVHHGVERRAEAGRLQVRVRARDALRIEVLDDGPGFAPGAVEGIGLGNLRARLEGLYGPRATLSWEDLDPGARVVVELPFEQA